MPRFCELMSVLNVKNASGDPFTTGSRCVITMPSTILWILGLGPLGPETHTTRFYVPSVTRHTAGNAMAHTEVRLVRPLGTVEILSAPYDLSAPYLPT